MNKHKIQDYLNEDTLTPSDSQMGEYANTDWWTACKDHFDDLLWLYYPDRTVFLNGRFPFNPSDPDNTQNMNTVIENIKRSFAIYLKSKHYTYSKLYETTILEYNPLYNVDGTEIEDRTLDQTGTDANASTGTDTVTKKGSESNASSGTDSITYTGTESNAKSGYDSDVESGSDTSTDSVTTYDSAGSFLDTNKTVDSPGTTDTHNYNSTDTKSFTNRSDSTTFGKTDTLSFTNRADETTYGKTDTETRNLHDAEHIERKRFGNIGVTKSTDLIDSQRETVLFDFYKKVVHDCVNLVSYAVDAI